jgi:hypothetical protein
VAKSPASLPLKAETFAKKKPGFLTGVSLKIPRLSEKPGFFGQVALRLRAFGTLTPTFSQRGRGVKGEVFSYIGWHDRHPPTTKPAGSRENYL